MDLEAVAVAARAALPRFFGTEARPLMELWPAYHVYDRVFREAYAAPARDAYSRLWATAPVLPQPATGTIPVVAVALADDFAATTSPRARAFPNGFRAIAAHLQPAVPWVVLRFVQPGAHIGLMFDGFVYVDGQFSWFPKPWKTIERPVRFDPIFDE